VNLYSGGVGWIEISIVFLLVILTLFHEFYFSNEFSGNKWYQSFIIIVWSVTFLIFSYRTNIIVQKKEEQLKKEHIHTILYPLQKQDLKLRLSNLSTSIM
jgi:hypothetical protein